MTRSANPKTFTVERSFDHPVSLLFWAFTDLAGKQEWYGGKGSWEVTKHTMDFRVGGWENWRGRPGPDAPWMTNDAIYYDIIPNERIIHSYTMTMDGKLFTVSQQVLEFSAKGEGSHLRLTEQILYIDGVDHHDNRVEGTEGLLVRLDEFLTEKAAK